MPVHFLNDLSPRLNLSKRNRFGIDGLNMNINTAILPQLRDWLLVILKLFLKVSLLVSILDEGYRLTNMAYLFLKFRLLNDSSHVMDTLDWMSRFRTILEPYLLLLRNLRHDIATNDRLLLVD